MLRIGHVGQRRTSAGKKTSRSVGFVSIVSNLLLRYLDSRSIVVDAE